MRDKIRTSAAARRHDVGKFCRQILPSRQNLPNVCRDVRAMHRCARRQNLPVAPRHGLPLGHASGIALPKTSASFQMLGSRRRDGTWFADTSPRPFGPGHDRAANPFDSDARALAGEPNAAGERKRILVAALARRFFSAQCNADIRNQREHRAATCERQQGEERRGPNGDDHSLCSGANDGPGPDGR